MYTNLFGQQMDSFLRNFFTREHDVRLAETSTQSPAVSAAGAAKRPLYQNIIKLWLYIFAIFNDFFCTSLLFGFINLQDVHFDDFVASVTCKRIFFLLLRFTFKKILISS